MEEKKVCNQQPKPSTISKYFNKVTEALSVWVEDGKGKKELRSFFIVCVEDDGRKTEDGKRCGCTSNVSIEGSSRQLSSALYHCMKANPNIDKVLSKAVGRMAYEAFEKASKEQ